MGKERAKNRLIKLDECIQMLEERRCFDFEKFIGDPMLVDSVERRLQLAVEIVRDIIVKDILRDELKQTIVPEVNFFQFIREKGILSDSLIDRLIPT